MIRRRIALLFLFTIMSIAPSVALAAGFVQIVPADCNQKGGCQSVCDIAQLTQNILTDAIYLAVVISAFLFAYAGFKMVTSGGNSEAYSAGRSIFTNVAIGLVIILVGWLIINALMSTLTGNSMWNKIC